jgi:VanZ family protein
MITLLFSIKQWIRITISFIYLGCLAILSLLPPNDFPELPQFQSADKIIHGFMYLVLAAIGSWSMHAEERHIGYYIVVLFSISWGIMMEIFQFTMHLGRSFEWADIISNSIGTFSGIAIYILLVRIKRDRELMKK